MWWFLWAAAFVANTCSCDTLRPWQPRGCRTGAQTGRDLWTACGNVVAPAFLFPAFLTLSSAGLGSGKKYIHQACLKECTPCKDLADCMCCCCQAVAVFLLTKSLLKLLLPLPPPVTPSSPLPAAANRSGVHRPGRQPVPPPQVDRLLVLQALLQRRCVSVTRTRSQGGEEQACVERECGAP